MRVDSDVVEPTLRSSDRTESSFVGCGKVQILLQQSCINEHTNGYQ
jgi:hypothetical protein